MNRAYLTWKAAGTITYNQVSNCWTFASNLVLFTEGRAASWVHSTVHWFWDGVLTFRIFLKLLRKKSFLNFRTIIGFFNEPSNLVKNEYSHRENCHRCWHSIKSIHTHPDRTKTTCNILMWTVWERGRVHWTSARSEHCWGESSL